MSGEINVISRTQKIVVNPTTRSVAVINAGPSGSAGIGVPAGGTTGQVLTKDTSTDHDTSWQTPVDPPLKLDNLTDVQVTGIPTNGQVLKFEGASGLWKPGVDETGASGGGLPPGGVIYDLLVKASSTDGHAVWSTVPQVSSLVANTITVRDIVGATYPRLTFGSGDGDNGTNPNPYEYSWHLIGDKLKLFSSRNVSNQLASFHRPSNTKVEFGLGDWCLEADATDNYLRFFKGSDRAAAEAYIAADGGLGCNALAVATHATISGNLQANGSVIFPWYVETPYLQNPAGQLILRSTTNLDLQGRGAIGSPACNMLVGAGWGNSNPGVYIASQSSGGDWSQRPLIIGRHPGAAGYTGIGFVDHISGWTGAFQLASDGNIYIGILNGQNTAYIKTLASAFQVVSGRRFKNEIEPLTGLLALNAVDTIQPIRYHDLQPELAAASPIQAMGSDGKPDPSRRMLLSDPPEPLYRYGFVAEEVREAAPLLALGNEETLGLDLSGMIAVLWQAVKELSAKVVTLETRLEGTT
jgi:hypothetical protein